MLLLLRSKCICLFLSTLKSFFFGNWYFKNNINNLNFQAHKEKKNDSISEGTVLHRLQCARNSTITFRIKKKTLLCKWYDDERRELSEIQKQIMKMAEKNILQNIRWTNYQSNIFGAEKALFENPGENDCVITISNKKKYGKYTILTYLAAVVSFIRCCYFRNSNNLYSWYRYFLRWNINSAWMLNENAGPDFLETAAEIRTEWWIKCCFLTR